MKKMWMIAAVACATLLVACGGGVKGQAEDYAKEYAEAMKAGKFELADEILEKADKYVETLSEEDEITFASTFTAKALEYGLNEL